MLYGKNTVGKENLWANEPHEAITAMITPSENVNFESENSQIILETLTDYVDSELELVFIGNICGFSSKFFCRQGKNLQAYFRMASIFHAVCNKICRKDTCIRL